MNTNQTAPQLGEALTKQSNQSEIRSYFEGVMRLVGSNEQFPVNLDEVWPLVYSEKSKAVRVLKTNFIENVDFQVLAQNGENGRPLNNYFLTTSCLEYFIARKVRPVFEVYRQVFHQVAQPKPVSTLDLLELTIKGMRENQQDIQEIRQEVRELKAATATRPNYFTVVGYGQLNGIPVNLTLACKAGRKASLICKARGIETDTIPDPRFGTVKMYPYDVLQEVFNSQLA